MEFKIATCNWLFYYTAPGEADMDLNVPVEPNNTIQLRQTHTCEQIKVSKCMYAYSNT